jgi:hypothetical protein
MSLSLSIIVPTRERAAYLPHCIRTCTQSGLADLEILILDNASTDDTSAVAAGLRDSRVRYVRSDRRLSMRDNFEKGLDLARGDILCFIGDDDGVLPGSLARAVEIFQEHEIEALSAARAHYFWPDLLSARRNTALLPRHRGLEIRDAVSMLPGLLDDADYYRLPCLYHGFVRRRVVERIKARQGRFFLSSQVDIFSTLALAMEHIRYAYSKAPLVINGGSSRSNGASHFGGGTDKEKSMWKQEDELGFLPGFVGCLSVSALIVESALRHVQCNAGSDLLQRLGVDNIARVLTHEAALRAAAGRSPAEIDQMQATAGVTATRSAPRGHALARRHRSRWARLARSFASTRPIDMASHGVRDVFGASTVLESLLEHDRAGLAHRPLQQITTALRLARG